MTSQLTAAPPRTAPKISRPQRRELNDFEKRIVIEFAQQYRRRQLEQLRQWEQEAAACRAEGHRPHFCVHGTNLWTDYDPICAGCEDHGYNGFDPLDGYRVGLAAVREELRRRDEIMSALIVLEQEAGLGPDEPAMLWARATDAKSVRETVLAQFGEAAAAS